MVVPIPESAVVVVRSVGELSTTTRPIGGLVGDDKARSSSCGSNVTNRVVFVGCDHMVRIWDADSGEVLGTTKLPRSGFANRPLLCCSRYGHRLATSFYGIISIWNLRSDSSLELVRTINTGHSIYSLCMNDDGSRIVSGHDGGYLCYWDIESGAELWSHDVSDGIAVFAVDISFDGAIIVSGGEGRIVRLLAAETGDEICQFRGHDDFIRSVQFNSDASRIASSSDDTTIRIWDVATRCQVMLLEGHSDVVSSLSYSCDGTRLASTSYDKTVRVWDAESAVCLLVQGHVGYAMSLSISSDGSRIASGGDDGTVIIWDSASGCEVMRLDGHAGDVTGVCYVPAVSDYLLK